MHETGHVTVSAPGSLMLMGEHAVLHGHPCLVTSVRPRIQVTAALTDTYQLRIHASLGTWSGPIHEFETEKPFQFVLEAARTHITEETRGLDLHIISEFSSTVGLGSSAAVTACVHAAMLKLAGHHPSPETVFMLGLQTIRNVQGRGSGADLAASTWGGTLLYQAEPFSVTPLKGLCPLTTVYSGSKKTTPEVIAFVERKHRRWPRLLEQIYAAIGAAVREGARAVDEEDWVTLGQLMDINQDLMNALGLTNTSLAHVLLRLKACQGIFGAKISGSGLGDCAIGLGVAEGPFDPFERIDAPAAPGGFRFE